MVSALDRDICRVANISLKTAKAIRETYVMYLYRKASRGESVRIFGLVDMDGEECGFESLAWQAYRVSTWMDELNTDTDGESDMAPYATVYTVLSMTRDGMLKSLRETGSCCAGNLFRISYRDGRYHVRASNSIRTWLGQGRRLKLERGYLDTLTGEFGKTQVPNEDDDGRSYNDILGMLDEVA